MTTNTQTSTGYNKPGTKLPTDNGNLLVNYHGIFFFMTHLGHYVPWIRTLKCGELVKSPEYARLKKSIGEEKLKPLTPFQEKCAAKHAAGITNDPLYKLTDSQKETVIENRENYLAATAENISVEEYLRRKKIRDERAAEKALKTSKAAPPPPVIKVRSDKSGYTGFVLGSLPIFGSLREKFA